MDATNNSNNAVWKFRHDDQKSKTFNDDQKLTFSLQLCDEDDLSSLKQNLDLMPGNEPLPKKRKVSDIDKDIMPQVLNEMEEEIERQLDSKAEKSNLTVTNVKNILKSVITNKDVMAMVKQTLHEQTEGLDVKCIYEPKLTRAKTKELLKQQPLSSNLWPITPVKQSPTKSECHVLIQQELPEDSSDEEYNPNEDDQSDEDDEKNASSVASDADSQPATPVSAANVSVEESSATWSQDGIFKIPRENIGQRTRSKLCLSDTPLEAIEQAFIPPDITTDMYEWGCDNDDWKNFLQEFSKPLDSERHVVDDPEEDPEYNVLADEEEEIVDKEELRMDRAVKVSRKELNELMAELFEYTENVMHRSSDDEDDAQSKKPKDNEKAICEMPFDQDQLIIENNMSSQQNNFQFTCNPVQSPTVSSLATPAEPTCLNQLNPKTPFKQPASINWNTQQVNIFSNFYQKENYSIIENERTFFEPDLLKNVPSPSKVTSTPNIKTNSARNVFSPLDLNELCSSSEAFLSIEKEKTPVEFFVDPSVETNPPLNKIPVAPKVNPAAEFCEEIICSEQILLLKQQLRQHVQLTVQHFLQCYGNSELSSLASTCKDLLLNLETLAEAENKASAFNVMNLKNALKVIEVWESLFKIPPVETSITSFMKKMYFKYAETPKFQKFGVPDDLLFPPPLLEIATASKAFIYPLLLPPIPFFKRCTSMKVHSHFFPSEERLLVLGLDDFMEIVKNQSSKFSVKEREWDVLPLIVENLMPVKDVDCLRRYITRKKRIKDKNLIKDYYMNDKLPHTVHYVIPVEDERTLLDQPLDLLPGVWKNFVRLKKKKNANKIQTNLN